MIMDIGELKKAAFLHDLGKLLNWRGYLHSLEGGRFLKACGYSDGIVAAALYHHQGHIGDIEKLRGTELAAESLPPYDPDNYLVVLGQLVDKLAASLDRLGLDRLGDEEEARRISPVALRNPITHLPMRKGDDFQKTVPGMRDFIKRQYFDPSVTFEPEFDDKRQVYKLDPIALQSSLIAPLVRLKDQPFDDLYQELERADVWGRPTLEYVPQGHHPPTDTLALWYHLQFSSALAGLCALEGDSQFTRHDSDVHRIWKLRAKRDRKQRKGEPFRPHEAQELANLELRYPSDERLFLKIGLVYIKLQGFDDFFGTSYRLPDFPGSQAILQALKDAVVETLLEARTPDGLPFIWLDSFFYRGHDDFLLVIPVEGIGDQVREYVYQIGPEDKWLQKLKEAVLGEGIFSKAAETIRVKDNVRDALSERGALNTNAAITAGLRQFITIEVAARCFAGFKDGEELTSRYGLVWNDLRQEVVVGLTERSEQDEVKFWQREPCDVCHRNLAWSRLVKSDDVLCPACFVRRVLGEPQLPNGEEREIALIKGNVNRTAWYVGGSLGAQAALVNADSVYSYIWTHELAQPLARLSLESCQDAGTNVGDRLEIQAEMAAPEHSGAKQIRIDDVRARLPDAGLDSVQFRYLAEFLTKSTTGDPFTDLRLDDDTFYNPVGQRWEAKNADLESLYKGAGPNDVEKWLDAARRSMWKHLAGVEIVTFPNPWCPYKISEKLEELVKSLFSGSPHFSAVLQTNNDLPTPSRTMTVSWLIDRAVKRVAEVAKEPLSHVIYAEGDEFLVVCQGQEAPALAQEIFKEVISELNSIPKDKVEALHPYLPVTLAMGMVVAKAKHPAYHLLDLADLLLCNAKRPFADQPYNRNTIDFEDVTGGVDERYFDRARLHEEWLSRRPLELGEYVGLVGVAHKIDKAVKEQELATSQLEIVAELITTTPLDEPGEQRHASPSRMTAAISYLLKKEVEEKNDDIRSLWSKLVESGERGTLQDLLSLWKIIRRRT